MGWIGWVLIAIAVAYTATVVWLWGYGRKRTTVLRHVSLAVLLTAVFAFVAGLAYVRDSRGLEYDLFYRLSWAGWLAMPPMLAFCYEQQGRLWHARWVSRGLYVFWSAVLVMCVGTDLIETGPVSLVPFVDRANSLKLAMRAVGVLNLGWLVFELIRTRRVSRGRDRQHSEYFLVGLLAYVVSGMLGTGGLQAITGTAADPMLTAFFSIPWMGLTLLAVGRHRLFDIRVVVSRATSTLVLVAAATATTIGIHSILKESIGATGAVAIAAVVTALVFVATPMTRIVTRLTSGAGHADTSAQHAEALKTLSLEQLLQQLTALVREHLHVESVALFLSERGQMRFAAGIGVPDDHIDGLSWDGPLVSKLRSQKLALVREELAHQIDDAELDAMEQELGAIEWELAIPISRGSALTGAMVLGEKTTGDVFSTADLHLMKTLATQAALAIENAQLYTKLEGAALELDELVRATAHDLRTPLRGIDNLASFTLEDIDSGDGTPKDHLAQLRKRVHRMEGLLDAVDAYVRAVRDEPSPDDLTLSTIIEDAIVQAAAPDDFTVVVDLPKLTLKTTRQALTTVVRHLIQNAFVHHDLDAGSIRVIAEGSGPTVQISVIDDGPGISPRNRERVFTMFRTLERRDITEHVGMGLTLCRKLITRAGGRIWVEAANEEEDRGTRVSFTWPRHVRG